MRDSEFTEIKGIKFDALKSGSQIYRGVIGLGLV